jgi:predicted nuclease of predicted toxin-antitoxin system
VPLSNVGKNPSDAAVWEYAKRHELVIVTKDADFSGRIILSQPLPWVVHIRMGRKSRRF